MGSDMLEAAATPTSTTTIRQLLRVTLEEMEDVMGKGRFGTTGMQIRGSRAAEEFTGVKRDQ